MNRRPDPAHRETDKIIERMEREISKEYKQAHEEVTAKLNDYLQRFAEKDETWRKWVAEGTKTEAEYKKWVKGQVLMGKRWQEMRDTLAQDYLNAHKIAENIANRHMAEVYASNHNYGTFEVERGGLIDTSYTLYSREAVERLWRENPQIYHAPGRQTAKDIRDGKILAWNRQRVQSAMTQGILQGESIPNLSKRLQNVTGGEKAAAIRNARTMATGIQNAGRMDAMKRAEGLGIKVKKQWLATLDERTRYGHRELDGVAVDIDEDFENEIGRIKYPGDPTADGENLYNCRCTLLTQVDKHEIDASDTSLRHDDNLGEMTYEEWKASRDTTSRPIDYPEQMANAMRGSYLKEYRRG